MAIWKNRPLFLGASLFMVSSFLSFHLPSIWKQRILPILFVVILIGVIACVVARCCTGFWRGVVILFAIFCVFMATCLSYLTFDTPRSRIDTHMGNECSVYGKVYERRSFGESFSTYVLDVTTIEGEVIGCRAYLTCYYAADLDVGDEVTLSAMVVSAETLLSDIYEPYQLLSDDILLGLVSENETSMRVLSSGETSFSYMLASHRRTLASRLKLDLGEDTSGMLSALLLGERYDIATDTARDFSRCGVSHLLAISGLHMTILFGSLALILKFVGVSLKIRSVSLGIVSFLYLCYLGFPPSATRAVVMLSATYFSGILRRHGDALTSWGVAGMGILLVSPNAVADVGFWLSFLSTLGLLTMLPKGYQTGGRIKRLASKFAKGVLAGVVAMSFTLLILTLVFGEISFFSVPMTLLLTPIVALLLLITPCYILLSFGLPSNILGDALRMLVDCLENICQTVSHIPHAVISIREEWILWVAIGMLLLTLFFLAISLTPKKRWLIFSPLLAGWMAILVGVGLTSYMKRDILTVQYTTPSSVAEMVVYTHGQSAVVCDFSNGSGKSMRAVRTQMAESGATEISALVITHYHKALSGNLSWLMSSEMVRTLYLPRPQNQEDQYVMQACIEKAKETQTSVCIYDFGEDLLMFGQNVLCVHSTTIKRSVQPVLLMTFSTSTQQMTYVGGGVLESDFSAQGREHISQSQAVIFGHHGPKIKQIMDCTLADDVAMICVADANIRSYLPETILSLPYEICESGCVFEMDGVGYH